MSLARLWQIVAQGELQPPLPLAIELPAEHTDSRTLHCRALLRLLPGKRAVFAAEIEGRAVLAKFFTDAAARQLEREAGGYRRLQLASQPTPALLEQLPLAGGSLRLYQFLTDAAPLFADDETPPTAILNELLDQLATMYRAGIYQADLHGGNFLRAQGRLFVIDPGAVEGAPGQPLTSAQVADNLGLLVAQFRRRDQALVLNTVLAHPLMALAAHDGDALRAVAEARWQLRKRRYLQKLFRRSSSIAFTRRFDRVWACRRDSAGADLHHFLQAPDAVMRSATLLKDGNSATVVRAMLDGREVVIKRYNIKGIGHWLRRFWRPSRAWVSWRNAHLLGLVGIDTPAPVAMLERRLGPLRGRAYYLCENVAAEELLDLAGRQPLSETQLNALRQLFAGLRAGHLHHGDLKAKNILIDDSRAWLIDLDALREIDSEQKFSHWHGRDVARFLRNWQQPALLATMRDLVTKR